MPTTFSIDPKTLRFLSLFIAPLFLILKTKLNIDVPETVQELLVTGTITYIFGSHAKEAIIKRAELAGQTAADNVTTVEQARAIISEAISPKPAPVPEVKP